MLSILQLQVQFMLGGNGRAPSPVDVVASSGEKSRLLLLIEVLAHLLCTVEVRICCSMLR
jgi:DNA repair ATPase RecN